jgi:predicted small integral membrane protein
MWPAKSWNGQESAFRFHMTLPAVVIFVNRKEEDFG